MLNPELLLEPSPLAEPLLARRGFERLVLFFAPAVAVVLGAAVAVGLRLITCAAAGVAAKRSAAAAKAMSKVFENIRQIIPDVHGDQYVGVRSRCR